MWKFILANPGRAERCRDTLIREFADLRLSVDDFIVEQVPGQLYAHALIIKSDVRGRTSPTLFHVLDRMYEFAHGYVMALAEAPAV